MKNTLKNLSEVVAKANDLFYSKFDNVDTLMGIMDKTLRNQGMKADAITIDCIALDKKIVILIHDDKPDVVSIALGNKEGDIFSSSEYVLAEISEAVIVEIMEENFTS
ncbi:hypothetical protein RGQ13_18590 [Thalassotalea psychrophila]|uniref:Orphan protein n=1 Tax=Thalassotalea psychrophila TaxID=3065647 RepID=A0ABY9TTE7_9GAMM|nr:hypothetical protein RGQ13_18590 [Colwelliaceae bacterium SQ149]